MATTGIQLVGRARDTQRLMRLLDRVPGGGGALVVRGDPGVGKSAMLSAAAAEAEARGLTILRTAGVRSEVHLPFAGLQQLIQPRVGRIDALPTPQRSAMLTAFGIADGPAPDVFLVGLATLGLLTDETVSSPIMVLAEDAHWIDRSSCDVLCFVARRVDSDPVVVLISTRTSTGDMFHKTGLPELALEPLDPESAAALLNAHEPALENRVRERVLDEAAGNPLALVELPTGVNRLTDWAALPVALPLTARLEQAFASRLGEVPAATQTVLLVAALNDGDAIAEALDAASAITGAALTPADLGPAIATGLVDIQGWSMHFRHPLVRSAIDQGASLPDRWAAHAALAEVLADEPQRSLWHLAAATSGVDEGIAADLEAVAGTARWRSGIAGAVTALERAAELSDTPAGRARRLVRAAQLAHEMARHDIAEHLLTEAERFDPSQGDAARAAWLRKEFEPGGWTDDTAIKQVLATLQTIADDGDVELACSALQTTGLRCWSANAPAGVRKRILTAAEWLLAAEDPAILPVLGYAASVERGSYVRERVARLGPRELADPAFTSQLATVSNVVGAMDVSARLMRLSITGLRAEGRIFPLTQALVTEAWTAIWLGDWTTAASSAHEAERLAIETGQPGIPLAAQVARAMLAGLRGNVETAHALASAVEHILLPYGPNSLLTLAALAHGTAALGAARYDEAYVHLRPVFDVDDSLFHPTMRHWALADFVEASVHSGHLQHARTEVQRLERELEVGGSPILAATLACVRPRVAMAEGIEPLFKSALSGPLDDWPFLRARLSLAYGAWLRRHRRIADSRAPLRAARATCDALGASHWGDRARQELRASGETSRRRTPDARDKLTPQEMQIARMAGCGLSNREIAERLYLSHRTVSSHLYRIFPKLGVASRTELTGALQTAEA